MTSKPKLLIISGITGIGKTDVALKVAKLLGTDIIVGDSLQVPFKPLKFVNLFKIYKNFPIASNFPSLPKEASQLTYHFLGMYDVLKQRISAFQYKEILCPKIQEIISQKKVPFIEGGCGFYLNYALSSNDAFIDYEELKKAEKKARDIIENKFKKNWEERQNINFSVL